MSKCPKCGCQCEDDAKFCDECGAPIPQEKECPKCHAHIGLNAKFCDECGFNFENVGTKQATIAMGDKNVIAGDVVAHKESYDIKGDATIVRNEDGSKKMVQCSDCGKNIPVSLSIECPSCHRIVCEECFDKDARKCKKCCGAKSSAGEEAYRTAILEALADGKIDVSDRKRLMVFQKQLGLSAARAIQIEKAVKSASSTTGASKNTATLDKVNAEKAYELLYVKGDYKKAAELLAPIRERNSNDENILSLYLAALTKFNPVLARKVVDDLHADVLAGALALIDIDMKRKDLASVEKRLAAAFAVWPDSVLLKCRKAVYAYEMFKATEDSASLMEATESLESIVDCKDAVEKSWQFFAKRLIDSALGDSLEPITVNDCLSRGLLWDVVSQNEDKSNALYRIVDLSDGPTAKFYPTYYMDTESIFDWSDEFKTGLFVMRRIEPGRFVMGKGARIVEDEEDKNKCAAHIVTISKAYYIGVFPVTQRQWELITNERPALFSKDDCYAMRPVENIGYDDLRGKSAGAKWPVSMGVDSNSFIGILRKKTDGQDFELPTEAQWEYACRAGTTSDFNDGKNIPEDNGVALDNIARIARFSASDTGDLDFDEIGVEIGGTSVVGTYRPNSWGLYDMHGNVAEYCVDAFPHNCSSNFNGLSPIDMPKIDPIGFDGRFPDGTVDLKHLTHGSVKGGCWSDTNPENVTSWSISHRKRVSRTLDSVSSCGVRLVIALDKMDSSISEWAENDDSNFATIPREIYEKAVLFSACGDLFARLVMAKALYYGAPFLVANKDVALRLCERMCLDGYGPAQTFLGILAINQGNTHSAVAYLKNASDGGDTRGFALLKKILRGSEDFNQHISECLQSLKMDYVCVGKKLERMIPRFEELATKDYGLPKGIFPSKLLGAFASEENLGTEEGSNSFVLFATDGVYLVHGLGFTQFNAILTWKDVVEHGQIKENYSSIQICSSPFAITCYEDLMDGDGAKAFEKIISIAKKFYKPMLDLKDEMDSNEESNKAVEEGGGIQPAIIAQTESKEETRKEPDESSVYKSDKENAPIISEELDSDETADEDKIETEDNDECDGEAKEEDVDCVAVNCDEIEEELDSIVEDGRKQREEEEAVERANYRETLVYTMTPVVISLVLNLVLVFWLGWYKYGGIGAAWAMAYIVFHKQIAKKIGHVTSFDELNIDKNMWLALPGSMAALGFIAHFAIWCWQCVKGWLA